MIDILLSVLGAKTCPWCRPLKELPTLYEKIFVEHRPRWTWDFFLRYDRWVGEIGGNWHFNHHESAKPFREKLADRPIAGEYVEDCRGLVLKVVEVNDDNLTLEDGTTASWMNCCDRPPSENNSHFSFEVC